MDHQNLRCFIKVSDTYLLECLRYREKYILISLWVFVAAYKYNSVVCRVITWAKFDGHIYRHPVSCYMQTYCTVNTAAIGVGSREALGAGAPPFCRGTHL